ncbi:hypothetical protein HACA111877_04705 [Halomonas casei]
MKKGWSCLETNLSVRLRGVLISACKGSLMTLYWLEVGYQGLGNAWGLTR